MFERKDVIKMVDALFHMYASAFTVEAKKSAEKMMNRREGSAGYQTAHSGSNGSQQAVEADAKKMCICPPMYSKCNICGKPFRPKSFGV